MIINTNNQSPDSVLTIAQTLTDTQKAQVRVNISSPIQLITASTTLTADHLEQILVTNGASTNFVFTVPNSDALAVGCEVAILNYLSTSTTIEFASGVKTLTENKGILTASSFEVRPNEKIILKKITSDSWLWTEAGSYVKVYNNAGAHNAIYRGENLGTAVTDAQFAAIKAGTFEDLYIGDYWVINGVTWRIAAFDYYLNTGDKACTTHHLTIVPDKQLYVGQMNTTATAAGGYAGSKMYTEGLTQAKTTVSTAFGETHILSHRLSLVNSIDSNGFPNARSWYDSTLELMTEQNVYGCKIYTRSGYYENHEIDKTQYPLFSHNPSLITNGQWIWLRDVISVDAFARIEGTGEASYFTATSSGSGVRPAFSIIG